MERTARKQVGKLNDMVALNVRISASQDKEIEELQARLKGSKARIVRDALHHYFGYWHKKGLL